MLINMNFKNMEIKLTTYNTIEDNIYLHCLLILLFQGAWKRKSLYFRIFEIFSRNSR